MNEFFLKTGVFFILKTGVVFNLRLKFTKKCYFFVFEIFCSYL